jgi:hypothetical protein
MKAKQRTDKIWMVEQQWRIRSKVTGNLTLPVRSVVISPDEAGAEKGAAEACRKAFEELSHGRVKGDPVGDAVVLYPVN